MKDKKKLVVALSVVVIAVLLIAGILWLPQAEQPVEKPETEPRDPVAENRNNPKNRRNQLSQHHPR